MTIQVCQHQKKFDYMYSWLQHGSEIKSIIVKYSLSLASTAAMAFSFQYFIKHFHTWATGITELSIVSLTGIVNQCNTFDGGSN